MNTINRNKYFVISLQRSRVLFIETMKLKLISLPVYKRSLTRHRVEWVLFNVSIKETDKLNVKLKGKQKYRQQHLSFKTVT